MIVSEEILMDIEVKVRAKTIVLQTGDGIPAAKMLFLIMILLAIVQSEEDGAIPM